LINAREKWKNIVTVTDRVTARFDDRPNIEYAETVTGRRG